MAKKKEDELAILEVNNFSEVEEADLFGSLSDEPRLEEYLRSLMKKDIMNYFKAPDDRSRAFIKGMHMRTLALIRKLQEKRKDLKEMEGVKKDIKIMGKRYGKGA